MNRHAAISFVIAGSLFLTAFTAVACKSDESQAPASGAPATPALSPEAAAAAAANADNPFFKPYGTPFNVPPFDLIKNDHFLPAIRAGIPRGLSGEGKIRIFNVAGELVREYDTGGLRSLGRESSCASDATNAVV